MKKLLVSALLLVSLLSLATTVADTKPAYCAGALGRCADRCDSIYFHISALVEGCATGCYIGYLLC